MKFFAGLLLASVIVTVSAQDPYSAARAKMADEIAMMARATAGETGRVAFNARVMNAIAKVERHRFVASGDEAMLIVTVRLPSATGKRFRSRISWR